MPPRERVALYHRVSSRDQDPTLARGELRRGAKGHGWRVVLDVEETASSKMDDRAGLARVLEAAHRRQIDVVLCWRLDRFGRTFVDTVNHLDELTRAGVRLVTIVGGVDTSGPVGKFLAHLHLVVAEQERDAISERTILGLERARERGKKLGRPAGAGRPSLAAIYMQKLAGRSWSETAAAVSSDVSTVRNVWRAALKAAGVSSASSLKSETLAVAAMLEPKTSMVKRGVKKPPRSPSRKK